MSALCSMTTRVSRVSGAAPLAVISVLALLVGCEQVAGPTPASDGLDAQLRASGRDQPATVTVTRDGMRGWQFVAETGDPAGSFVDGPGDPPLGSGSARFTLDSSDDGLALVRSTYNKVRLDKITRLEYCTYQQQRTGNQAVALQLNFDDDVTDGDTSWKGRLVFEPSNNGGPADDAWQCWDAIDGGDAMWWSSAGLFPGSGGRQSADRQRSWDEILAAFPDAGLNAKFGSILLKAGSGWGSGFVGSADALEIGIGGAVTVYDFEAPGR